MTAAVTTLPGLSAGTWTIDPVHSTVSFSVRHLMVSKVRGEFTEFSGQLEVAADGTPSVTANIATHSVTTKNEQRDEHLKANDFFDSANHPTAVFKSTGLRAEGDDLYLDGDFTLRGITKNVSLALEFNGVNPGMGQGEVAGFEASTVINRKEFGVNFDAPLENGGAVVGDKVTITLDIEAIKQ
ncbi:YceI family protein [Hoyosella rhizosphaerae]|uniref:Polyisoprenoid-binding protein n=1 Tax=Hoyosella rhizosphaerae TaxID=1755582 RepID=A0A916X8T5_9ACTN|nr:YceI family protein [Hoyosella rhizosphaerae]MBN4927248.1 YceI family protein [Hoyosella rhizosphaerae]GGC52788.1 polyisoprenoid-binding protein [Hoyosella rhizosphaerae]